MMQGAKTSNADATTPTTKKREKQAAKVTIANQSTVSTGDGDAKRVPPTNVAVPHNGHNNRDAEAMAAFELRKSNGTYTITMNAMTVDGQLDATEDPIVFRLAAPKDGGGGSRPSSASSFDVGFVPPAAIRALRPQKTRRDVHTAYNRDDFMPVEKKKNERRATVMAVTKERNP